MSLRERIEAAFKAYLESVGLTGVYTGLGNFNVQYPAIVCTFLGAEEIHKQAFTFRISVLVTLVSAADPETDKNAKANHDRIFNQIVEALEFDNLADLIETNGTDLRVNGVEAIGEQQPDLEPDENEKPVFSSGYEVTLIAGHI